MSWKASRYVVTTTTRNFRPYFVCQTPNAPEKFFYHCKKHLVADMWGTRGGTLVFRDVTPCSPVARYHRLWGTHRVICVTVESGDSRLFPSVCSHPVDCTTSHLRITSSYLLIFFCSMRLCGERNLRAFSNCLLLYLLWFLSSKQAVFLYSYLNRLLCSLLKWPDCRASTCSQEDFHLFAPAIAQRVTGFMCIAIE
jgi:hypothetical protein